MALPSNPNQGGLPQRPGGTQRPGVSGGGQLPPQMPDSLGETLRESSNTSLPDADDLRMNDRLSQYDFGSQGVERPGNMFDADDAFESIPSDEVFEPEPAPQAPRPESTRASSPVYSFEEEEQELARHREAQARELLSRQQNTQSSPNPQHQEYRPQAGKLDKKGQNVHIDEGKKKLKPFGGKKSLKVSDVDPRKNRRQQARTVQTVMILLMVVLIGFGVYNAVVPKPTLTTEDVVATVQQTVDLTDFPLEEGRGFAEDFMQAYLNLGNDPSAATVLNYYYTGTMGGGAQSYPNRLNSAGYGQDVLFGPTIYGAEYLTDEAGRYTIGALVQPKDTRSGEGANSDGVGAVWQFFNVNVYYDSETDRFSVTPDSPSLISTPSNLAATDIPDGAPVGTGEEIDNPTSVEATLYGFLEAYRTSSADSPSRLEPFLPAEPEAALLNGLNGAYNFVGEDPETAVSYTAYATDTSEVKVQATVNWQLQFGDVSNSFFSQYIITMIPTENGYVVSQFAPYYYVPSE